MAVTDPIADMLTRIRNALKASHEMVDIPSSNMKINIAKVMRAEGYIKNFKIVSEGTDKRLRIFLKYDEIGLPIINGLKRISKPSCRVYNGFDDIPKVLNGYGISILSTSKGIMTDKEAREARIGGEILCSLW